MTSLPHSPDSGAGPGDAPRPTRHPAHRPGRPASQQAATALYPRLNPAVRVLWREPNTVQLELGERAVIVEGITAATVSALTAPGPRAVPANDHRLRGLRQALGDFLWPRAAGLPDPRLHPPVPLLAGELSALSARHGESGSAVLHARRTASVAIHGPGRAGPHIAAILAAAGVGRVYSRELSEVHLHQLQPGGLAPADETAIFATATANAVHRAAPQTHTLPETSDADPDLVVLAYDEPIDDDRRDGLMLRRWAHLPVALNASGGVIGPLVMPGMTSCLRCTDLHRLDRDPAWTALAVQLSIGRRHRQSASVAAATVVAGAAAMQVLAYLDGEHPATVNGTIELHEPGWALRRRSWPPHEQCDCQERPGARPNPGERARGEQR